MNGNIGRGYIRPSPQVPRKVIDLSLKTLDIKGARPRNLNQYAKRQFFPIEMIDFDSTP